MAEVLSSLDNVFPARVDHSRMNKNFSKYQENQKWLVDQVDYHPGCLFNIQERFLYLEDNKTIYYRRCAIRSYQNQSKSLMGIFFFQKNSEMDTFCQNVMSDETVQIKKKEFN